MTAMAEPGRAVQILNLVEELHAGQEGRRQLKLDTQVLNDIVKKAEGHPLAVIAIAGPERQGKSFILSYFVRYLQALESSATGTADDWMERDHPRISMKDRGFAFENSFERTTEGIWMWSRPFVIPRVSEPTKKLAVLLMDTEGCYGSSLSAQEQAAIVGLSLLTSSVFIYNEAGRINDNTIATLGKFMEYGQLSQSAQGRMFQRIMFLVRDWNRPGIFEYGSAGGQSFIQGFFKSKPRMSKGAAGYRKAILEQFEDINAYLMPHPGEQVMSDQFTGSVGEMKPEFAHHVELFVTNLIADVTPKRINNKFITGSQFVKLFHRFVAAFNTSDMPSPASIIEATRFIAVETEIRGLAQSFEQAVTAKTEEFKAALRRMLHGLQRQAEEEMEKVKQDVVAFVRTELSNALDGLTHSGSLAVHVELGTSTSEVVTNLEQGLSNGHGLKKDVVKRKLQDDVDSEQVKEARKKALQEMNKENQAVRDFMDTVLSSFAFQINDVLQSGKYIAIQKLDVQLDSNLRKSLDSFKGILLSMQVSPENHFEEMKEKLIQKKRDLLQRNAENLGTILEQIGEIVRERYEEGSKLKSHSESEQFRREVEAALMKYLQERCEGDCDQDVKSRVIKKVNDQHDCLMTKIEAEVNGKIQELVEDAVMYYNDSMKDRLLRIMPAHPADVFDHHLRSSQNAVQKLKTNGCFITTTLETEVTKALKQAYKTWMKENNLKGEDSNLAIGIDLGTTHCSVAIHRMGKTRVLKDQLGRSLIPSFLFIREDGSAVVGHEAKDQVHIHPEDTVFDAKRLVGRKFNDSHVQNDLKMWPFKVIPDLKTKELRIMVRGKSYRPEEVLAQQLRHMTNIAEEVLAEPGKIKKAVITVPANFNDRQRDATRQAAQIADLEVLQLINEPTAAAMASAAVRWQGVDKTILVFDFGGGTLDVTILRIGKEKLTPSGEPAATSSRPKVKASMKYERVKEAEGISRYVNVVTTVGDMHLGGEDVDSNVVRFCAGKFEEKEGIKLFESENPNAESKRRLRLLRKECEALKVRLTSTETSAANLDNLIDGIDLKVEVTRKEFEEMNEELFQKAIKLVGKAVEEAKLSKEDIDGVLMFGGSSLIPRMRVLLQQFFDKPAVLFRQGSAAGGAAIQACIVASGRNMKGLPKVNIRDVQPFSLGIRLATGELSVIIPRNTSIPVKRTRNFTTETNDQTYACVQIFSGEDSVAGSEGSTQLGRFTFEGIPTDEKGKHNLVVTMEIDASGILSVTAFRLSMGETKNLVCMDERGRLSDGKIMELRNRFKCSRAKKVLAKACD